VDYHDPYIPHLRPTRHYNFDRKSIELKPKNLKAYDVVLISTNHSIFDMNFIVENSQLVVDTRNACKQVISGKEKIYKA